MLAWKPVGAVIEGDAILIDGVNPWKFDWHSISTALINLPHPSYPKQYHQMRVYEITVENRKVVFAAGELSMNVWGFYILAE